MNEKDIFDRLPTPTPTLTDKELYHLLTTTPAQYRTGFWLLNVNCWYLTHKPKTQQPTPKFAYQLSESQSRWIKRAVVKQRTIPTTAAVFSGTSLSFVSAPSNQFIEYTILKLPSGTQELQLD